MIGGTTPIVSIAEGDGPTWLTNLRKIFFGYTEEETKKLKEDFKKVKEQEKQPWYDSPIDFMEKQITDRQEMFIGLFLFLILVMMFKR